MEPIDLLQAVTSLAESISTVVIVTFAWLQATKRADRLQADIIEDWKRQNDRELLQPD